MPSLLLLRAAVALALAAAAAEAVVPLRILHVNDNHARFEPATTTFGPCTNPALCFGGFPRMAAAVKAARAAATAAGQDILVLHAGGRGWSGRGSIGMRIVGDGAGGVQWWDPVEA
jgi:2',3'-cyclic-nucleotide 2'-phosphodiesterase (5'-nucleotidase family)